MAISHSIAPASSGWRRRALTVLGAALAGGGFGYAFSTLVALAACETGTCPVARDALPVAIMLAIVCAGAAWSATRR